jgi:hypothetical protein
MYLHLGRQRGQCAHITRLRQVCTSIATQRSRAAASARLGDSPTLLHRLQGGRETAQGLQRACLGAPFTVVNNEALHPVDVALIRSQAVMQAAQPITHLGQQFQGFGV